MKFIVHFIAILSLAPLLSACVPQTPLTAEEIKQQQLNKLTYAYVLSECSISDQLNQARRAHTPAETPVKMRDCNYYRSHGKYEGYKPASQGYIFTPDIMLVPQMFMEHQENKEKIQNSRRAGAAHIPVQLKDSTSQDVYRNLIYRGFNANEVNPLIKTPIFKQAVSNYRAMKLFH